jgi:drug/metabolite transporter (DMT)-like permease
MWAIVGAVLAAIAYGAATVLQAMGVRRLSAVPSESGLIARARAGWLYAAGLALDALGYVLSFAALRSLPLFLVESMLASSVGVTAVLAVEFLGVRLSKWEVLALIVTGIGLVLLAISAHEGAGRRLDATGGWLLLAGGGFVAVVFVVGLLDRHTGRSSVILAIASGLGFGLSGIVARVLHASDPLWHTLGQPALWALVLGGAAALLAYGFALDRGRTTSVAAITFAVETVIPAGIGLALLGDHVRSGFAVVAPLGFAVTLAGCLALAGRAEIED